MYMNNRYEVTIRTESDHVHIFVCNDEHFNEFMLHLLENPAPFDQQGIEFIVSLFCYERAA